MLQPEIYGHPRLLNAPAVETLNGLPEDETSSPTLSVFRKRFKAHLFRRSYPNIV